MAADPGRGQPAHSLDARLDRIGRQPFRAKFHLRGRERGLAQLHGGERLRRHAHELIAKRLARSCLQRNHGIGPGIELTAEQQNYVVDVIMRWIGRDLNDSR